MRLHDVRKVDWRDHRTLGSGVIDLVGLVRGLDEAGYRRLTQFELEEPDQEPALIASMAAIDAATATA